MPLCTLFPRTHSFNAPFKEKIKSLIGIILIGLSMPSDERFQLSENLLDRLIIIS